MRSEFGEMDKDLYDLINAAIKDRDIYRSALLGIHMEGRRAMIQDTAEAYANFAGYAVGTVSVTLEPSPAS